jgi:hypothetical protein
LPASEQDCEVRFPYGAVPGTRLLEEDLNMSDHTSAQGNSGDQLGSEPDVADDAREAAMMRAVMRAQEKHREGGIDPELDEPDADPGPDS